MSCTRSHYSDYRSPDLSALVADARWTGLRFVVRVDEGAGEASWDRNPGAVFGAVSLHAARASGAMAESESIGVPGAGSSSTMA